jgi:hypothetical protein
VNGWVRGALSTPVDHLPFRSWGSGAVSTDADSAGAAHLEPTTLAFTAGFVPLAFDDIALAMVGRGAANPG